MSCCELCLDNATDMISSFRCCQFCRYVDTDPSGSDCTGVCGSGTSVGSAGCSVCIGASGSGISTGSGVLVTGNVLL